MAVFNIAILGVPHDADMISQAVALRSDYQGLAEC